jgi:alpha-galactosidase
MTRVCRAVAKYTRVRCVGLCHGLVGMQRHLSRLLSRAVEVAACGMNHLNWIHAARWKDTGGDAWPEVQRALLADADPTRSYTRELFEIFGRIVTPDDQHISDFLYHWRVGPAGMQPRYHMLPKAFDFYRTFQREWEQKIADCLSGRRNPMADLHGLSGEGAIPIICATRGLTPAYEECAVNIPNGRCIPNLAPEAVVEVPAFVDTRGVTGRAAGPLPLPLRSLIERQMEVAELAVEAAAEGSRTKALQALAIDPLVPDLRAARAYLDDVLATHKDLLPAFA